MDYLETGMVVVMTDRSAERAAIMMFITSLAGDFAADQACRQIPEDRRPRNYEEFKCFHEAGHVVAWHVFGNEAHSVIVTEGAGAVTELWPDPLPSEPRAKIPNDEKQRAAQRLFFDVELNEDQLRYATWFLIQRHWKKVEKLARELIVRRSLDQNQIAQILKPTITGE